jgi:hypothetical protein
LALNRNLALIALSAVPLRKLGISRKDLIECVGTSSGATAAAHVRSGIPPAELLASILSEPVPPVGQNRQGPPSTPMAAVYERMRAIGAAATSAVDLCRAMGAFGLESDATLGPAAAEQRRAMVAARLPRQQWPDSFSNWLANKGKVEPKTVQGLLRHSKIQTTLDLYTQEDSDETRAAQGSFLEPNGNAFRDGAIRCGLDCGLLLWVPYIFKSFGMYGGDDGARTRDLCRDS